MPSEEKPSSNPNGNNWAKDDNKFGQKMLEKMGWSKGKGLGKNEDGNPDHIKVSKKRDIKGLGYKGYDDTWVEHQDAFEKVLGELNGIGKSETNVKDVKNLTERSQNSKSRVHRYKKIVAGKDLSSKSEKDMKCIFGTLTDKKEEEDSARPNRGNMNDYFAKKMEEKRKKNSDAVQAGTEPTGNDGSQLMAVEETKKRKTKRKLEELGSTDQNEVVGEPECNGESVKKRLKVEDGAKSCEVEGDLEKKSEKKKKKKLKEDQESKQEEEVPTVECNEISKKKKSRKNKSEADQEAPVANEEATVSEDKKAKKKKLKEDQECKQQVEVPSVECNEISKKKKSKKSKPEVDLEAKIACEEATVCEDKNGKKKKKKSKVDQESNQEEVPSAECNEVTEKKKKNRKSKPEVDLETQDVSEDKNEKSKAKKSKDAEVNQDVVSRKPKNSTTENDGERKSKPRKKKSESSGEVASNSTKKSTKKRKLDAEDSNEVPNLKKKKIRGKKELNKVHSSDSKEETHQTQEDDYNGENSWIETEQNETHQAQKPSTGGSHKIGHYYSSYHQPRPLYTGRVNFRAPQYATGGTYAPSRPARPFNNGGSYIQRTWSKYQKKKEKTLEELFGSGKEYTPRELKNLKKIVGTPDECKDISLITPQPAKTQMHDNSLIKTPRTKIEFLDNMVLSLQRIKPFHNCNFLCLDGYKR